MWRTTLRQSSRLVSFAIIVLALYFGKDFFIPFALAVLASLLGVPVVQWLELRKLGRIPSVLIVVVLMAAGIGGIGVLVVDQLSELATHVQTYRETVTEKLHTIQSGTGFVRAAASTIQDVVNEALGARSSPQSSSVDPLQAHSAQSPAQPVSITGLDLIRATMGPLLGPLATLGIAAILMLFILIQREDLRDRMIRMTGEDQLTVTIKAMNDARQRITRFLFAQLAVNLTFGAVVGVALFALGVPNPLLWGILGALLRYIPYIGSWIAMTGPLLIAFATKDWMAPFYVAGLFIVLELSIAYVLEPLIYGANTGITAFAVLVAAFFWTMLWGSAGLLLAIPLTVCVVVMAKYVPSLSFIDIALGAETPLENYARFYQRVLAMDKAEAESILEKELEHKPIEQVYHEIVEPAKRLLEKDHRRKHISDDLFAIINAFMMALLDQAHLKHPTPKPA